MGLVTPTSKRIEQFIKYKKMEKNCTLQWFTSELLKQCLNPKKRAKLALIFLRMKRVVINGKERLISVQALFLLLQLRLHGLQFNSLLLTELFHCQRSTEVSHERERRQRWRCWGWHWNTGVGSVHSSLTPVASQLGPGALHGDQPWLHWPHCAQARKQWANHALFDATVHVISGSNTEEWPYSVCHLFRNPHH